jgi:thermitase
MRLNHMGNRFLLLLLCNYLILNAVLGFNSSARADSTQVSDAPIIPGEVVIVTKIGYLTNALNLPMGASIAQATPQLDSLHAAVMRVPIGQERNYVQKLQNTPGIQFAEPNYVISTEAIIPNDPFWSRQYGPAHLQAPDAWSITTGSSKVTLAIIDSGIDNGHPEFAGRILPGYDFVDGDDLPQDACGHGTHVTGIAAATGNNRTGIAGMDWNVRIMPIRVLDGSCSGSTAGVAEALVWAVEHGARLINMSLGTSAPSTLLENGTYYAYTHGAAIFAAAGNSGSSPVVYPAAYPWVMAVGATDQSDQRASYSNTGAALDLMSPGSNIFSTTPYGDFYYHDVFQVTQQYGTLNGTSMASAFAAGSAALLASLPRFDTPDKIYQALTSTARDLDIPGRDNNTGYGLIQVYKALNFTSSIVPTPTPLPPMTSYDILDSRSCGNLVKFNWQDATTGSQLPVFGNDGYATLSLPFAFKLGDQTYDNVTVSANGYMTFGDNGSIKDNFLIPGIAQPNNFIAPFWDDLNPSAGGKLYQQTFGAAPNRQYAVEWYQVPRAGDSAESSSLTFEAILFEGSNQALTQYQTLKGISSDGSSATIGVEYANGTAGKEYSYNQAGAVIEGQALLFVPYPTGDTPPSNTCNTFTRLVDGNGGFFDSPPFCVDIPAGALQHPATLQIQNLAHSPALPGSLISLDHFADISLSYSPAPPLSPMPVVYVCYHYTTSDVLRAGGHPENLFLAAFDPLQNKWDVLPTSANPVQGLLTALAPHLSIFGVVTTALPAKLPVTGSSFALNPITWLVVTVILCGLVLFACWRRRRTAPRLR